MMEIVQQTKKKTVLRGLSAALIGILWMGAAPFAEANGPKRVVISKGQQLLRAYEGDELVFESRISTGRRGKETPSGTFRAGGKQRMHYSSRYHNAPMPYSVVVKGHYFIHGYSSVPDYPASNGCIRLPIEEAEWFYHWVTPGTPIRITGR